MKFVITAQEFNFLINKCFGIISTKPPVPILSNFLIEAVNGQLIITATDLTVGIRCQTEVKVLEEGAIVINAKRLSMLSKELTSTDIEFRSFPNEKVEIIAGSSVFKLNGANAGEYPGLQDIEESVQVKVPQNELKEMLFRTSFAVSREDNRYVLTGLNLRIANGEAVFIGTDAKRLAKSQMTLNMDRSFSGNFIIPYKAVEEILNNLQDDGEATLFLAHDKIAVDASNTTLITKLLTGDYPDVTKVIPNHSDIVVALHREELITILRQIALFADASHPVRFSFSDGELRLTSNTMDTGEGKVSMPVNYRGQKLDIAFNPHFFLDILRHTTSETVAFGVTDAFNPGVIIDNASVSQLMAARSLFVLMPMRLNNE